MYAAIPRARGILPRHNKTGRPNPGTSNSNTWRIPETKVRAQQYIILNRSHGQVTKVPSQAPHITAGYSADIRNRTLLARVSLNIQKPKPQASIINKREKIHKLFDVYNTIHKRCGWPVAMAMLPPSSTKPITMPWQCGFNGEERKKSTPKPRTKWRGVSYGEIGLTTVAVTQNLLSGMQLVL